MKSPGPWYHPSHATSDRSWPAMVTCLLSPCTSIGPGLAQATKIIFNVQVQVSSLPHRHWHGLGIKLELGTARGAAVSVIQVHIMMVSRSESESAGPSRVLQGLPVLGFPGSGQNLNHCREEGSLICRKEGSLISNSQSTRGRTERMERSWRWWPSAIIQISFAIIQIIPDV